MKFKISILFCLIILLAACEDDDGGNGGLSTPSGKDTTSSSEPTPYNLELPPHFALIVPPVIPNNNQLTVEGIALGKKLFYEKMLSKDNSISCASCHNPREAFNDKGNQISFGVDGSPGIRNAMPLFNLAWVDATSGRFNWDGSFTSLESQAFEPVKNHFEMKETWVNVVSKLQNDSDYPEMFEAAFQTELIDSNLVVKAIAQFERTLISGNSRVDKYVTEEIAGIDIPGSNFLSASELNGLDLFMKEQKGDCFHCHGSPSNPIWTSNRFSNSGLDAIPDSGLARVSGKASDLGKFRIPSVRNLLFTPPYMHDGRFNTLEEVVEFYASGVQAGSPNIDPNQKNRNLTTQEKADIVAFLKALTDSSFVKNPDYLP